MKLHVIGWNDGGAIPSRYAFGQPGEDAPFAPAENRSPEVQWSDLPAGTRSLALIFDDRDVPSKPDDVNQPDRQVPADLPRCPFHHWVLVDIPVELTGLAEGAGSAGLVARGKPVGATPVGVTGQNDYTGWFAGDPDMAGLYGGYDGPCPPWNDSIVHHYTLTLYALATPSLGLSGAFTGADALAAMKGHVLGSAAYAGKYSMNPAVPVV